MSIKKAAYHEYPDELDVDERPNPFERIVIERREIIGEIVSSPNGTERMVVAAFQKAGEYLDGIASQDGDPVTVQFEYRGKNFFAGYGDL